MLLVPLPKLQKEIVSLHIKLKLLDLVVLQIHHQIRSVEEGVMFYTLIREVTLNLAVQDSFICVRSNTWPLDSRKYE